MLFLAYSIMCFIFGTVFLFTKVGLALGWTPFLFAGIRFTLAGLIVTFIVFIIKKENINSIATVKDQLRIVLIGVFMTGIPFAAVYWSLQYLDSGTVAVLVATGPFFIYIIETCRKKTRIRKYHFIGISLCSVGILFLSLPNMGIIHDKKGILAILFLLISEVFFAIGSLKTKDMLAEKNDSFSLNGFQMFYGGLFLLLMEFFHYQPTEIPTTIDSLLILIYFIFVASILSHSIYYWLIKKTNAFIPSTQSYVTPLLALTMGSIYLGESLSLLKIASSLLIIMGLLSFNYNNLKNHIKNINKG